MRQALLQFARIFTKMSGEPEIKMQKVSKLIGTHNGTFHCDEVLACFLLRKLPEYEDAQIIRSRDQAVLKMCDIVVDVGGVFDVKKNLFDHHQREFKETMNSLNREYTWTTKLSSAGLIYFYFGHEIISLMSKLPREDERVKSVYKKVYENFIQEIDAIDNGISQLEGEPKYLITTNLSSRVSYLNPAWNDPEQDSQLGFDKAMVLVGNEFTDRVNYFCNVWWPARKLVFEAIEARKKVYPSGEVLELLEGGCPWKDHLFTLESELVIQVPIKFVIFTDQMGLWRVLCVPICLGSFLSRLPLPESWRGLRDEELCDASGISGCTFVHSSGFTGGNKTRDGLLKMIQQTLLMKDRQNVETKMVQ